jgi:predicted ATPase
MRPARQALRFTHLLVRNWRNFTKADVDLGGRVFLTGPSSVGKSNFLDILCFLSDLASPGLGFQEAVRKRGGVRRLRCLAARQESDLALAVHAGDGQNPAEWEYELVFNQEGQRQPSLKRERLSHDGEEILVRPDKDDDEDPVRLSHSLLEQGGLHKELRDFAAFLETVRCLHPVPALMRDPPRPAGSRPDPSGADILEEIAATLEKSRHARLRLILETLRAAIPQLGQLEAYRDSHGRPHLRARHEHWRPQGAWQSEEQLSDGTLCLIGLAWAVISGAGPLLIEEPEASLHPEIIRLIPQMLTRLARRSGRQLLLSTHSLDLLCGEGVETAEILILNPAEAGTLVRPAFELKEAADLLDRGALATEPAPVGDEAAARDRQMGLFGETPQPE